ncbi:MAG TPA: toll/interleukin-1 receptor domain-containing protein [Steroidobacteraceae bacterium]|nr:toll/interleukin-1 receptor domain-containing protein [Steroidobacteraceae bacterium]
MRLYIAYSSQDTKVAERVQLALLADNHEVFRDRTELLPGDHYDGRFREALSRADMLIFLISPASVRQGCYALTELGYARERWPHPKDHVLPVIIAPVPAADIPAYLQAVTILNPKGSVAAEVAQAIRARTRQHTSAVVKEGLLPSLKSMLGILLCSALLAAGLATAFSFVYRRVTMDPSMALLFLIAGLCGVLIVRGIWNRVRSS